MKFETLLARRYIYSQKRHSLLTIISIIIAVALMTTIFTSYTTLTTIQHASHYDKAPYHMQFSGITEKQADYIEKLPEVGSFERKEIPDQPGLYSVNVLYSGYLDDSNEYLEKIRMGLNIDGWTEINVNFNTQLMEDDLVTLEGRVSKIVSISGLFIFVIFLALALRLVIDTAFEVSSKERERQFGVLQSVGATPMQIVKILTNEGLMLSVIGVPIGALSGIGLGFAAYKAVLSSGVADVFFTKEKAEQLVHFNVNPWMVLAAMAVGTAWVWLSAWGTGKRIIKMTPIQAISNRSNTIKKVKKHTLLGLLFGWKGKLAARNARRQPKRFVVTVLSLTISLSLFACFAGIIEAFSNVMAEALIPYDALGQETSELDIAAGLSSPNAEDSFDIFEAEEADGEPSNEVMMKYYKELDAYQKSVDYHDATRIPKNAEKLMSLGYFESVEYYVQFKSYDQDSNLWVVTFANEAAYNRVYNGKPSVSYADFEKSGKAVAVSNKKTEQKSISVNMDTYHAIDYKQYLRIQEENKTAENKTQVRVIGKYFPYDENGEPTEELVPHIYSEVKRVPLNVDISDAVQRKGAAGSSQYDNILVLPYSYYVNNIHTQEMYVDCWHYCTVFKDGAAHNAAVEYLKSSKEFYAMVDMYKNRENVRTILSAVNIGVTFGNIMLALIAIINMVNIISTGILNRKSEFGSLQCIGMTRGQLLASTIYECVQFVLIAGIAASILCYALLWGTDTFVFQTMTLNPEEMGQRIIPLAPVFMRIGLGTAVSFIVALIASILPLNIINKQELVDQIRTVE